MLVLCKNGLTIILYGYFRIAESERIKWENASLALLLGSGLARGILRIPLSENGRSPPADLKISVLTGRVGSSVNQSNCRI
jgi:hypothetical protein